MTRGRPSRGPQIAQDIDSSSEARHRLELMLETVAGTSTVKNASERLGISETRFHALRTRALTAAAESLEPLPAGRPAKPRPAEDPRVHQLQEQVRELTLQVEAASIREEIALTMPHLLVREARRSSPALLSFRVRRPRRGRGGKRDTAQS
jgi:hypothetical protein